MRRETWWLLALLGVVAIGAGGYVVSQQPRRLYRRERADGTDPKLQEFLDWWQDVGPFPLVVTSGVRTDAEQAALYAKGRTAPGPVVTNAATTASTAHGLRLRDGKPKGQGFDAYPVKRAKGSKVLEIHLGNAGDAEGLAKFEQLGAAATKFGLVWGGKWTGLPDRPHIETPDWRLLPRPGVNVA